MAQNTIFSIDAAGDLVRMAPGAPAGEVEIQSLIARFPDMLGDDGDLLTICREAAIGDSEGGSGRWSLDNLFVTRTGVPVLVEVKRASDTRIRREVVGQMLDYAANAVKHWPAGEMARSFAARCDSEGRYPAADLADFLDGDETDFWDRVDANLKAGKLRLLFVADHIPPELARVVEFLNEQMQAEVLAVELSWFVAEGGARALVPHLIGATQRAAAAKQGRAAPVRDRTIEEWIAEGPRRHGEAAIASARDFIDFADRVGGISTVVGGWVSLALTTDDGKTIKPFGLYAKGAWAINLDLIAKRPAFVEPAAFVQAINGIVAVAGSPSTGKLTGYPSFATLALANPATREPFIAAWINLAELARRSASAPILPTS